jgi:hypothetical protein
MGRGVLRTASAKLRTDALVPDRFIEREAEFIHPAFFNEKAGGFRSDFIVSPHVEGDCFCCPVIAVGLWHGEDRFLQLRHWQIAKQGCELFLLLTENGSNRSEPRLFVRSPENLAQISSRAT